MNNLNVMDKIKPMFQFLKSQKRVFNSFSELTKREKRVKGSHYSGHGTYISNAVNSDHLLLLNLLVKDDIGKHKGNKCIGIAVTYKGLSLEDSFFVVSISDVEKKLPDLVYLQPYYKSRNLHKSFKIPYSEFAEKLRKFNKLLRNGIEKENVVQKFEEIFELFTGKSDIEKNNHKDALITKNKSISKTIAEMELKEKLLISEMEKRQKELSEELGIVNLKEQENELLKKINIVRKELGGKMKSLDVLLHDASEELKKLKNNIKIENDKKEEIKKESLNLFYDISFLK